MHEVSVKDKEKEHLTLLQDAEEMKVMLCAGVMRLVSHQNKHLFKAKLCHHVMHF